MGSGRAEVCECGHGARWDALRAMVSSSGGTHLGLISERVFYTQVVRRTLRLLARIAARVFLARTGIGCELLVIWSMYSVEFH